MEDIAYNRFALDCGDCAAFTILNGDICKLKEKSEGICDAIFDCYTENCKRCKENSFIPAIQRTMVSPWQRCLTLLVHLLLHNQELLMHWRIWTKWWHIITRGTFYILQGYTTCNTYSEICNVWWNKFPFKKECTQWSNFYGCKMGQGELVLRHFVGIFTQGHILVITGHSCL